MRFRPNRNYFEQLIALLVFVPFGTWILAVNWQTERHFLVALVTSGIFAILISWQVGAHVFRKRKANRK